MTDELRAWIATAPFRFARTMPENPHSYIVQREHGGPEFDAFVSYIEGEGSTRHFRGWPYKYVELDGFDYWLTWGGDAGHIVNRKPTGAAGWDDE